MASAGDRADRRTKSFRRIDRVWGLVIVGITLMIVIDHAVVPDPHATDYLPAENLLPLAMCLSVARLGVALRWETL